MTEIDEIASVLECMISALDTLDQIDWLNSSLAEGGYPYRFVDVPEGRGEYSVTIGVAADA